MQKRYGFISNSSSSSFIIKDADEMEQAEKLNCEVYPVKNIIDYYQQIYDAISKISVSSENVLPEYMRASYYDNFTSIKNLLEDLKETIKRFESIKDYSITSPVDRDYAYRLDIDLELYEGDL